MKFNPTEVMDHITKAQEPWLVDPAQRPKLRAVREEVLGLKYRPGEIVKDSVSGKEVEIIGGTRETVTISTPGSSGS